MNEEILQLEKAYCPPIDSALLFAIVSDYDLSNEASLAEVRLTLDALKESALAEESTAFDPSGSSNLHYEASPQTSVDRPRSWNGDALSRTDDADLTSLSSSVKTWGIDTAGVTRSSPEEHDGDLESLSTPEKEALLTEMFPTLKPFDIAYGLQKSKHGFSKTVEELLSQAFLLSEPTIDGEAHVVPRGIEAFTSTATHYPPRKAKGGKRRKNNTAPRRSSSTPAPLSETSIKTPSKWEQAQEDVEFLSQRTYLDPKTIASTYHTHNASLATTILAFVSSPTTIENPYIDDTDPLLHAHAIDLATDFPTLSSAHLHALCHLTHPSTASAHDLAAALAYPSHHNTSTSTSSTAIIPQYALPDHSAPPTHQPPRPPTSPYPSLSGAEAHAFATSAHSTSTAAFANASSAYRTSKSRPLHAGVAAYYSSVGRDALSQSHAYASRAADALVASQSSGAQCDLHGVNVKDGVRIARERVQAWWDGGVGEWARQGKVRGNGGYRLVVGKGGHSEGGKGKLGPAVGGMLVREGWRVEVGEGILVVRGRARK